MQRRLPVVPLNDEFTGQERRRFVRLYIPLRLKFRLFDPDNADQQRKIYSATTKDISIKALCMTVPARDREAWEKILNGIGTVKMEIMLPGRRGVVKASGEALRLSTKDGITYSAGVIFTAIQAAENRKLLSFIRDEIRKTEE